MNKKDFERRFGESREKYLQALRMEKVIRGYLERYGYDVLWWVVSRITNSYKEQRNLKEEIATAEKKLEALKSKRV